MRVQSPGRPVDRRSLYSGGQGRGLHRKYRRRDRPRRPTVAGQSRAIIHESGRPNSRANLILLDSILGQYGADARPIREHMRSAVGPFADRLWREKEVTAIGPFHASAAEEQVFSDIQKLSPLSDVQRSLQSRALQIGNDIAQARFMLFTETES